MMTIRLKLFMTRYLFGILLMLLFFCFSNASAQTSVAKGTVKDTKGNPLPGVTVQVKGVNKFTSTSSQGSFSIDAPKGSILEFRLIGYESVEVTVNDENTVNVTLTTNQKILNEVVVVG